PEIEKPNPSRLEHEDVGWLEIAMNDASRVGGLERIDDGIEQVKEAMNRQALADGLHFRQVLVEIGAGEQLHDEVERPVERGAQTVDADRAGACEGGHDLRLAQHADVVLGVDGNAVVEELQCDFDAGLAIDRRVDDAVSPSTNDPLELVAFVDDDFWLV